MVDLGVVSCGCVSGDRHRVGGIFAMTYGVRRGLIVLDLRVGNLLMGLSYMHYRRRGGVVVSALTSSLIVGEDNALGRRSGRGREVVYSLPVFANQNIGVGHSNAGETCNRQKSRLC